MGTLTTDVTAPAEKGARIITIEVTRHGTPYVDCEPAEVDKNIGDSIEWRCDQPFRIRFASNPFVDTRFDGNQWVSSAALPSSPTHGLYSGLAKGSVGSFSGPFKYSIEVNDKISDPTVVVKP